MNEQFVQQPYGSKSHRRMATHPTDYCSTLRDRGHKLVCLGLITLETSASAFAGCCCHHFNQPLT